MGDPRRLKKKYRTPSNPFEKERIVEELAYLGKYGLRNKKELWKHKFKLSRYRRLAREARALPEEFQAQRIKELLSSLSKIGLVNETSTTDDILSLTIENILERRLQTQVYKIGLAKTIVQARQFVVHRHISINGAPITSPSYIVKKSDEGKIDYAINSKFKALSPFGKASAEAEEEAL